MESFSAFCNIFFPDSKGFGKFFLFFSSLGNEFVKRRVKKPECDR